MSQEKIMTEQESLKLITEMLQKTKSNFHENGTGAILWGSVIAICGIFTFLQLQFDWQLGNFDIWYLALVAIIPQIVIATRDKRQRVVKTHMCAAMDAVWLVYGISIFALIFYFNTVGNATDKLNAGQGIELLIRDIHTGAMEPWHPSVFSKGSLLLLLYAMPTLITGIARKFKPMLFGGILCYIFFMISCFTASKYDFLMNGLAAIFNWLIPGFILRSTYLKQKTAHV